MSNILRTIAFYLGIAIAAFLFGALAKLTSYGLARFDYRIDAIPKWLNEIIVYIIAFVPVVLLMYLFGKVIVWLELWSKGYYDKDENDNNS